MPSKKSEHSFTEHYLLYGSAFVLIVLGFVLAYQFVEPAPPRLIRIATGDVNNAYYQFAEQYKARLAREGIELEVLPTAGSLENLQRLTAAPATADIAFVQGGVGNDLDSSGLTSLGSVYFEPLWVFHNVSTTPPETFQHLYDIQGKRIAIGGEGSGTRAISSQLLALNGIDERNSSLLGEATGSDVDRLIRGDLDVLFIVASPRSDYVRRLLTDPNVELFSFERADAYTRNHRFLSSVSLPAGVIDLASHIPRQDKTLLAPAATLVVHQDFHPALAGLMLQTLADVHGDGGLFELPGQFPTSRYVDYPLSDEAKRYFSAGPSFLQRYLPFWAADLIDRLIVMLVPLVTLMIPLMKVLPPTYRWRVRSRIYRWYDQLKRLDVRASDCREPGHARKLLTELEALEQDVMRVQVPQSYADAQYNLRIHLRLIRERLEGAARKAHAAADGGKETPE